MKIFDNISVTTVSVALFLGVSTFAILIYRLPFYDSPTPHLAPYALLVETNLVHQPCPCGFCNPSTGVVVPEHINQLGYDLKLQVSTNYLPIVYR